MKTFCTVITKDYLPYAIALYKSLRKFDPTMQLQVLVVDGDIAAERIATYPGMKIIPVSEMMNFSLTRSLYKKYAHTSADNFRWSLKPVFIRYLLTKSFTKVIFTDCDVFFYEDYAFLFNELENSSILLTPHWRCSNPLKDEQAFLSIFSDGIYNAGFIGASMAAIPALEWWAQVCHYQMVTDEAKGLREDQGYLDLVPVQFENVVIIRHKGCNISAWNQIECKRILVGDKVLINGIYPIVFIHFNTTQFTQILKGHDALLLPYLHEFKTTFEEDGSQLAAFHNNFDFYYRPALLSKLKWKLRIRTRIKRTLYLLAQKI